MLQEQFYMKKFDCKVEKVHVSLKNNDIIDSFGGLKVIHVPGHTPGSIALYQSEKKVMIFGDVIRNKGDKGLVIGVPDKFNFDTNQTIKDAQLLSAYPIKIALFGHGIPISNNVQEILLTAQTQKEFEMNKRLKKAAAKLAGQYFPSE